MPSHFAIVVAIAVAATIAVAVATTIANTVITISPLGGPLCLLIVVLSGGQSYCYQQWCYCHHHGRYIDDSIAVVAMAALND
jgi:hypothetical protein